MLGGRFGRMGSPLLRACHAARSRRWAAFAPAHNAPGMGPVEAFFRVGAQRLWARPAAYMTIPLVAATVGFVTNWVGVQMLFYPLSTIGPELYRAKDSPYGLLCWQGVVPTKAVKMGGRLVEIVTARLLSLPEAFSRLDPDRMADLLQPSVEEAIRRDAPHGRIWAILVRPFLHRVLRGVVVELHRDVEDVLDLREVVQGAFLQDRGLLVELFQKVGRMELDFLVNSGAGFGFILGWLQMSAWVFLPWQWTLPVAGALVGYVTNWLAIKLIFEPVEPWRLGPFTLQGLFEKRQPEVTVEFSEFLQSRVLTSQRLIGEMVDGNFKDNFQALLRRCVPFIVPDSVVVAAAGGLRQLALEPGTHPAHVYITESLAIRETLSGRLLTFSSAEFENLLHPVFQEDEIILIIVGGILGAFAGAGQMVLGWGGPAALKAGRYRIPGA
mmetsp:Transcript_73190/g.206964  ORF Transcript_73190/g.206964 Transcript_73190/m.206964 type:complete len:440 (-) Transcript_73190:95-1414(-)